MRKGLIKQIYAYVICAACVGGAIIFLCIGIYSILSIAWPEFTMPPWHWKEIATFQSFKTDWEKSGKAPSLSDEDLRVRWLDKRDVTIQAQKRDAVHNLIWMGIYFIIAIPLFAIHWRMGNRLRLEEA
ncbi:MAG: hypothetical protein FJY65_00745 [Calditrichaeota bacterium]|nr:hypothetical protein [Calditrichota bacterium]